MRERLQRWRRIGRAAVAKAGEGPGPLLRAVGRTLWRVLPARWRGGELRRFRAVADLRFVGPEPGIERAGMVSVVLPVYDQANLLGEAVASVLAQTHADLELIVLDDGSRDDVPAALAPFRADARLRHLRQTNRGLPKALTAAFESATGEFHTWTSADNLMHPRQLERLVAFLRAHPERAMVFADYALIDEAGAPLRDGDFRILDRTDPADRAIVRVDRRVDDLHRVADNFVGGCFLYRGRASRLLGDYSPVLGLEDYDYWLRLDRLLGMSHLGTREVLYRYRVHDNTLTAKARELRLRELAVALLQRERQRAHWFATPPRLLVDRTCAPWVRSVAAGLAVEDLTAAQRLAPPPRALLVCAAEALDGLDFGAMPATTLVAAHFDHADAVWRHGEHLAQGSCIALCDDAATAGRLSVFTRTVFVAPTADQHLELALRRWADRTFFLDGTGLAAALPPAPTPATPRTLRVHAVGAEQACRDFLTAARDADPDLQLVAAAQADVIFGLGTTAGAENVATRGAPFVLVCRPGEELSATTHEVPHVHAFVSADAATLARLDAGLGAAPDRLLWLPPAATLAPACLHLARWLCQGGAVPGARAHLARAASAQLP